MPVRFFEGVRPDQLDDQDVNAVGRRNVERRFYALAAAVKDHEARRATTGLSHEDEDLYCRLRQLGGAGPSDQRP